MSEYSDDRIIELRVSNQKAYVWNVDDLAILRAKHRVCGILTGTLPHVSQQNVFLGIPLLLMPEEVVLLVEKHFAVLVDDPSAHSLPSVSALGQWNAERKSVVKAQLAQESKGAKEDLASSKSMSEDAIRKRRLREEKRAAAALAKRLAEGGGEDSLNDSSATVTETSPHSTTRGTYTVTVPGDSASHLAWYASKECTYSTVEAAMKVGIWSYPSNAYERAKCGVFQDLWEQGHYMGGGIKFGGDYLVYPGDPLRYHSHFVATVIDSHTAAIAPMEIVAHGRLGTATKKAHLLCSWDEKTQKVSYYSVEWAGFG